MKRNTGVEPVIYRLIGFAVCILKLEHGVRFELTKNWFAISHIRPLCHPCILFGADSGTWTHDLFLTKEVHYHCVISALAPPKRFELLTPSFVAKYSNPLSYGGINFWVAFLTRHTTPVRDVTVTHLPAGRMCNYLIFVPVLRLVRNDCRPNLADCPGRE